MSTRPSEFLNWTDGDGAKVVDPPSAQKTSGWTAGEPPPFQYMNWLFWLIDQWIQWLDAQTNPAESYSTITGNTTGAYPITTYFLNPVGATFTFTLPSGTANPGVEFALKNIAIGSSNVVHMARTGSDTLEGAATAPDLTQGDFQRWKSDGTNWWLVGGG